jgi:hypothetical protein
MQQKARICNKKIERINMQSFHTDSIMVFLIVGFIGLVTPTVLTIWNIYNSLAENPKLEKTVSCLTVFIGGIFYMGLFTALYDVTGEWYDQINSFQHHKSISGDYYIRWIVVLGFIGYFVLLFNRADKLAPLKAALSISFLILMNIIQVAYAIQISKNVHGIGCLFYFYHINILVLSARAIHRHMKEEVEIFRDRLSENKTNIKFSRFYNKINSISKYSFFIFVVFFFVVALIEVVFVLLGQGLDAPIKAFTDTADWTFSKQTPPPPVDYDGHYLCTVAAGGHRKVVKPIRLGTRRNETIVVNRQLCIANAFEELIQEKTPRFHKKVREFYDTHGYPLSRKITTQTRADFIYIIMKPLEWIFLIVLYAFDLRPEQRISRQYAYVEPTN